MMMRKESVAKETLHLGLGGVQPCDLGDLSLTMLHLFGCGRKQLPGLPEAHASAASTLWWWWLQEHENRKS